MDKKHVVLYVDDEPTNLLLFKIHFPKKYTVLTGNSGSDGLALLHSNPEVVVVVSDMKMPGMNGIEFIKAAKAEFPKIVFYILTGFDITDEIAQALDDKLINKYFSKPFNVGAIDASIEVAIESLTKEL